MVSPSPPAPLTQGMLTDEEPEVQPCVLFAGTAQYRTHLCLLYMEVLIQQQRGKTDIKRTASHVRTNMAATSWLHMDLLQALDLKRCLSSCVIDPRNTPGGQRWDRAGHRQALTR